MNTRIHKKVYTTANLAKPIPIFVAESSGVNAIPAEDVHFHKVINITKLIRTSQVKVKFKEDIALEQSTKRKYPSSNAMKAFLLKRKSAQFQIETHITTLNYKQFNRAFEAYKPFETLYSFFTLSDTIVFTNTIKKGLCVSRSHVFIAKRRIEQLISVVNPKTGNYRKRKKDILEAHKLQAVQQNWQAART